MKAQTTQIEKLIEWGLLLIVAVMPFHAFLSVWLGSLFGHEAIIQAWKEALLLVLAALAAILVWREPARLHRLQQPWVIGVAAFAGLALLVTVVTHPPLTLAAFGLKTDLEFLLAAVLAAFVAGKPFVGQLVRVVLIGAAVVTGFDLLQIFMLPPDFLTHFGYGPSTILPYQHITQGTSALRFPATLGGPNQLGTYLILPLCLTTALFMRHRAWWQPVLFAACLISLVWTFSRSAWLGAALAVALTALASLPARARRPVTLAAGGVLACLLLALPFALTHGGPLQYYILHSSVAAHDQSNLSDSQHSQSLHNGAAAVLANPLGHGLGTAGPATFHAATPNIIENYYLQVGYETGALGALIFIFICVALILALRLAYPTVTTALPAAAAIVGVGFVALVLPSWADSTTALVTWTVAGAAAGAAGEARRV